MKHKIHWPQLNRTIEVEEGTSVLDAALDHEIDLEHACGGFCACTTCHIYVREGQQSISKMESEESERLEYKDGRKENSRLACQSKVYGDLILEIP